MARYGDYIEWGGSAGQPVYYRQPDGTWRNVGAPEHGESAYYVSRALTDPQVDRVLALYNADPSLLNNEQQAFIAGGLVALDSLGQGFRWGYQNLSDNVFSPQQSGALLQTGFARYLSAADIAAGTQFNFDESPAQQSARDDSDDFLSDIIPIVAIGAGLYFGIGALAGAAAEGAAVVAGAEVAGAAATGVELGALGSGLTGVEIAGAGIYGTTPLMAGTLGSGLAGIEAAAIGLNAGALGTIGAIGAAETLETTTVSLSETQAMNDDLLSWWDDINSTPDPFATTDSVNAGWTYENGYGVDWYNSAGIGEAANSTSLDSILSTVNKVAGTARNVVNSLAGLSGAAQRATAPAPNLQRAAGSMSLPLIVGAVLAFKFL